MTQTSLTTTLTLPVEQGALTSVPVYQSRRRGRNWCAVISKDPTAPNGLARTFLQHARGEYYYLVNGLAEGAAVEFGADYYSNSGRPTRQRWYGVVTRVTPEDVTLERCETAAQAILASAERRADRSGRRGQLQERIEAQRAELAPLESESAALDAAPERS